MTFDSFGIRIETAANIVLSNFSDDLCYSLYTFTPGKISILYNLCITGKGPIYRQKQSMTNNVTFIQKPKYLSIFWDVIEMMEQWVVEAD